MTTKIKLTKRQREFLAEVAQEPRRAVNNYPPAVKLAALGLIEQKAGWYVSTFSMTDEGRAFLWRDR